MRTSSLQAAPFGGDPLQNGTLLGWRWLAPLQSKPLSGAQGIPPHTHTRPPPPHHQHQGPASDRGKRSSVPAIEWGDLPATGIVSSQPCRGHPQRLQLPASIGCPGWGAGSLTSLSCLGLEHLAAYLLLPSALLAGETEAGRRPETCPRSPRTEGGLELRSPPDLGPPP